MPVKPTQVEVYWPFHRVSNNLARAHPKNKDDTPGKGGGAGALNMLSTAVEQEEHKQELHSTLEDALRLQDILAAEVRYRT